MKNELELGKAIADAAGTDTPDETAKESVRGTSKVLEALASRDNISPEESSKLQETTLKLANKHLAAIIARGAIRLAKVGLRCFAFCWVVDKLSEKSDKPESKSP